MNAHGKNRDKPQATRDAYNFLRGKFRVFQYFFPCWWPSSRIMAATTQRRSAFLSAIHFLFLWIQRLRCQCLRRIESCLVYFRKHNTSPFISHFFISFSKIRNVEWARWVSYRVCIFYCRFDSTSEFFHFIIYQFKIYIIIIQTYNIFERSVDKIERVLRDLSAEWRTRSEKNKYFPTSN